MRRIIAPFGLLIALIMFATQALAVNPDEVLEDPQLEARARALSVEIRCLVCQNQSIDDSDAQLARDLRVLVREQLVAGKSDQQILDFLVERYGEFVLLKPRFTAQNLALWLFPFVLFVIGIWLALRMFKKRRNIPEEQTETPLSEKEKEKLARILKE